MLDLNDFRVFEKVAKLKSFSAAARALGLPKSSVSRCVARLEDEVGIRLIQRTTRSVQLTEAGALLLIEARRTLRLVRKNSMPPTSSSSPRICMLKAGCTICSRCAARPKWLSSATATK